MADASPQVEHVTSKIGEDEFNESEFGKLCTEMVFYLMQKENKALVKIWYVHELWKWLIIEYLHHF